MITSSNIEPCHVLYLFGYKMGGFFFHNNPKNLDLFYKTDLEFGLFWKGKPHLIAEFHNTNLWSF